MKKTILTSFLLIYLVNGYSQTMQATIKRGSAANIVGVYLKPSASFSQKDEAMNLALAIPATAMPAPSLGTSGVTPNGRGPVAGITGVQPSFIDNNLSSTLREVLVSQETINAVSYYVYSFIFSGTAQNEHSWVAGQEQLIFSISFGNCNANCATLIKLVNIPNGGSTRQAYWYFQPNTLGDITNYQASFYANPDAPNPVNGGGSGGTTLSYLDMTGFVLPVKIIAFNTAATDCNASLTWKTTQETNFAYYGIERSENAATYYEIGRVPASGTASSSIHSYTFTDDRSPAGEMFYRLKLVDKEGKYSYSAVSTVNMRCHGKNNVLVYPNLTSDLVNIKLPPGFETAQVKVINAAGKVVHMEQSTAYNRIVSLRKLAGGVYLVQVINHNHLSYNTKVILQH